MIEKVEVFGKGCSKCKQAVKVLEMAISELGLNVRVEKVEDLSKIVNRGIVSTPAIAINGKVVISGRVPTLKEAKELLSEESLS
uniref:Thioredoxin family protein n=1 Tax=Fervidobacterium thailandense TaxID=1008305 RepID=A0A7C4RVS2_9BACT